MRYLLVIMMLFSSTAYACGNYDQCMKASRDCMVQWNGDTYECVDIQIGSNKELYALRAIAHKLDEISKQNWNARYRNAQREILNNAAREDRTLLNLSHEVNI